MKTSSALITIVLAAAGTTALTNRFPLFPIAQLAFFSVIVSAAIVFSISFLQKKRPASEPTGKSDE